MPLPGGHICGRPVKEDLIRFDNLPGVEAETSRHVPTSCTIDTKQRVAFISEGRIPTTDIEQHVPELENDPDFGPGFFELAHPTSVTEPAIDANSFQRFAWFDPFALAAKSAFVGKTWRTVLYIDRDAFMPPSARLRH